MKKNHFSDASNGVKKVFNLSEAELIAVMENGLGIINPMSPAVIMDLITKERISIDHDAKSGDVIVKAGGLTAPMVEQDVKCAILRAVVARHLGYQITLPFKTAPEDQLIGSKYIETESYVIEVDMNTLSGKFTHKSMGADRSGTFNFEQQGDNLVLSDYTGVFMLPPQVEDALPRIGIALANLMEPR